tara:strand:- start:416 stop:1063 length:648 start_codon:yes stop_codon:yes gene_type:complete
MYLRLKTRKVLRRLTLVISVLFFCGGLVFLGGVVMGLFGGADDVNVVGDSSRYEIKKDGEGLEEGVEKKNKRGFVVDKNVVFDKGVLDLDSYVEIEVLLTPGRVILADNCTVIAVDVTLEKSRNIARALSREYLIRPTGHDIIEEVINNFGIEIERTTIDKIGEGVFYGHLVLSDEENILNLDVRPSDALAVSLRYDSPVYVHKDIFEELGQDIC